MNDSEAGPARFNVYITSLCRESHAAAILTHDRDRKEPVLRVQFMDILQEISGFVQKGRVKNVEERTRQALAEGIGPQQILDEGLLAGMSAIGEKFRRDEVYVPEVLLAARAMNAGTEMLRPLLAEKGAEKRGKAVLGTVRGDQHDIGKNLVRIMMEGKGIEVIDLGVNVPPEKFIETARDGNADIIGCSALLTTTMGVMKEVVQQAEAAGLRDRVKIMVGGAPVSQSFCDEIGADCYTEDAASAADAALAYLTEKKGA